MRWSGTLQQNKVTGDIMTSSSDFFASLNLTDTHGITWLGNYGNRLCIAPSSPIAKIRTMIFELGGPTSVPFSPFPEGFVGDFIPVSSAGAAILNTPASNVGPSIQQANAALTERAVTQAMQPLACPLGVTVRDEHRLLSRGPTPVRPDCLAFYLKGYNNVTSDYLIRGFLHGFSIRYFGSLLAIRSPNLKSAMDNPTSVNDKLSKELAAGRIVGPFDSPPFETFRVSPLGIVPKKLPGEFRLIHHLSYPEGLSVNDGIPKELATVRYATVDDAVRLIKAIGKGCFLAKTDIKSAFRIIPVAPRDFPQLGMEWQGKFFFDKCLPMGCSSSCNIFETFSTALEWIAKDTLRASSVLHILDDFLFIAPSEAKCQVDLCVCRRIGVPIADEKTMGPTNALQFAGITLDTALMEARLPEDKLAKCRTQLADFCSRKSVTLKELQSLIGLPNFACCVVVPGRAFLRRLIDLTRGIRKPTHHVRLTKECKNDLNVWLEFLSVYNGKSFFLGSRWATSKNLNLFTDAAGSLGYAAIFGKHWCFGEWPSAWKQFNITILEFFPIVLAIEIWGPLMRDKCIVFFSDNQAVVEIINRQTSKDRSGTLFSALLNTIFCFVLGTSLVALTARAMLYLAYR